MSKICKTLFLVALAIFASVSAQASPTLDRILAEKKIRVGIVPGWPKFIVMDPQTKEYSGFLPDDLKNFERRMKIKVEFVATDWTGIVAGLQTGKYDVMVGAGITPERASAVAFGEPYAYFYTSALTKSDAKATSLADLDQAGKVLTVVSGTAMDTYARNRIKKAKIEALSSSSTAILNVMQGRADAYIGDSWTNYIRAKERPGELKLVSFKSDETEWGGLAFAVRYADSDVLTLLNAYVAAMKLERWYQVLTSKYELEPDTPVGPR